ncbi:MAG TPA: GNAT family protein [Symbiobacteriaceae bacterium]|jgi:RimJ/RimL family protein N-acetyltransferase|nr:GNAT family protein [Symbiobacteriaceae bacterium]
MPDVVWGELIGLRPLRPSDAAAMRRFVMDPEVAHLLFEEKNGEPPSAFALGLMIFFQNMAMRTEWGIVERDGRLIGSVKLWRISERNRSAMLTIYIGEHSTWSHGYGTDALRLALRQAFGPLGLNRVELHVFEFNGRAIRCYEKAGFVREGVRRSALARGSQYHNILVMGILRDEFFAREAERESAALTHTS